MRDVMRYEGIHIRELPEKSSMSQKSSANKASADQAAIAHFAKDSGQWWNDNGPFAPLHRLNPVRLNFITDAIHAVFPVLKGLSLLDIGCGGGLVCEPLARLGAKVTGLDADANAIRTAKDHAGQSGLVIDYQCGMPENLDNKQYDVVLALEVIEHVTDPAAFMRTCNDLVKPGGVLICSTLNRTPSSYALGIVAAEHILRWVPVGTHQWKQFVKPSELDRYARAYGLDMKAIKGIVFNPLKGEFNLSDKDIRVNYIAAFHKPA